MASIGDLFMRVLADMTKFEPDLVKKSEDAGDKAGQALGKRMGAAIKTTLSVGLRLAATVAAAALGIATKGALELQNAIADFQAQTGASAEESKAAGKVINKVAGQERTSLDLVTAAAIAIRQNLGATGPAADKLLAQFVRFARVTKQEPVAAVAAFDDILDAWSITADHSGEIMDKLVVSNQKYGGSIAANEAALAALAPYMKAANLSIDDGIGLLNLFATSGVDAALAPEALTKALSKVKSPAELQKLIDDIIATEDPFLRAQKAADLFGAKAGPKLANVLKPGIGSLQDFQVANEDVTGATDKAADILDKTWSGRVQKAISVATAELREFGASAGPALTGLAALGTLIGPLLGPAISKGLGGAWKIAGKSGIVTKAVAFAGDKAATIYVAGLIAGDAIGGALRRAWTATGGRLIASAAVQGALSGTAFAVAAGAAIVAAPLLVLYVAIKVADDVRGAKDNFRSQIDKLITGGSVDALKNARRAIQAQVDSEKLFGAIPIQFAGEVDAMNEEIKRLDAAIAGSMTDADKATEVASRNIATSLSNAALAATDVIPKFEDVQTASGTLAYKAETNFGRVQNAAKSMREKIAENAGRIATVAHELTQKLLGELTALITGYYDPLILLDDLRVQKDDVTAAKVALAATKAGTAQRHQAQLTLDQASAALDQTRANLLASGQLSAKEQKTWLTELQAKYKTATGDAKTKIGELITKIKELQNVDNSAISIVVTADGPRNAHKKKALGGPVQAGVPYIVGERRPELFVPEVKGRIVPDLRSPAAAAAIGGGDTIHVTMEAAPPARDPFEVARQLQRVSEARQERRQLERLISGRAGR